MSNESRDPNHYDPFHYNPQGFIFNRSATFPFFHENNNDHQTQTDPHHHFDPFTDLNNSALDFHCFSRIGFDISCSSSEVICPVVDDGSNKISVVVGDSVTTATESTPLTPNSSVSSSSNEGGAADDQDPAKNKKEKRQPKGAEVAAGDEKSKKANNNSKKGKRERGPRFAFLTKSDMDHLEDGYRWRKYGQKAVKNSPYPRSYYRCTSQKCTVKKRVERSFQDPGVVITTYEGQHNHHCPANLRGNINASSSLLASANSVPPAFPQELLAQLLPSTSFNIQQPSYHQQQQLPVDYGLLQDLVPSFIPKQAP